MSHLYLWKISQDSLNFYVAKKYSITSLGLDSTSETLSGKSLEEVRNKICGLVKIPRSSSDDRSVVESWY